eukprot:m.471181 g.471181  ORF g.471181 m.471181 type:complete len:131 (-) comp20373_c0_seq17:406-798(-)
MATTGATPENELAQADYGYVAVFIFDRGISNIAEFSKLGIKCFIPGQATFSQIQAQRDRSVARLRNPIESITAHLRTYSAFDDPLTVYDADLAGCESNVARALYNLTPGVHSRDDQPLDTSNVDVSDPLA